MRLQRSVPARVQARTRTLHVVRLLIQLGGQWRALRRESRDDELMQKLAERRHRLHTARKSIRGAVRMRRALYLRARARSCTRICVGVDVQHQGGSGTKYRARHSPRGLKSDTAKD